MPARADRSVGEAALQTGAIVGVFMITVWGLGTLGHLTDEHVISRISQVREISRLSQEIQRQKLSKELNERRAATEEKSEGSED
jgi:hypothetical protein